MANFTNHPPTRKRKPSVANTSGIPGVSFKARQYGKDLVCFYVQVAYTDEKGKLHNYQRSVHTHGVEGAMKFALSMRRKMGVHRLPSLVVACDLFYKWRGHEAYRKVSWSPK